MQACLDALVHHLRQYQLEWLKKWGGLFDVPPWPHWANDLLSALGAPRPFPADPPSTTRTPTRLLGACTHALPAAFSQLAHTSIPDL